MSEFGELWLVETESGVPCVEEIADRILYQVNGRSVPSIFRRKESAMRAIDRTLRYAKEHDYEWGPFRIVRFSRG